MPTRPGGDFDRDILDIIPERFDADADSRQARSGYRLRTIITLLVAVVVVGGIVAAGWRYAGNRQAAITTGVPVIKADQRPIKVHPDDPGGMQVPDQDKLVYERMDGGGQAKTERLLAPPEQPAPPPRPATPADTAPSAAPPAAAPAPVPAPVSAAPASVTAAPPSAPATAPVPVPAVTPATAPAPAAPVQTAAKPGTSPGPKVITPPPAAPAPAAPAVASLPPAAAPAPAAAKPVLPKKELPSGSYVVQLGAVRSADAADKEWSRIQHANAEQLGALKPDIVRVELGDKGTFWRVRAGPLSEQAARSLCEELAQRNQGCIVARK